MYGSEKVKINDLQHLIIVPVPSKHKTFAYVTFIQHRPNVFDVGPTTHTGKCYTKVLCLLLQHSLMFTRCEGNVIFSSAPAGM